MNPDAAALWQQEHDDVLALMRAEIGALSDVRRPRCATWWKNGSVTTGADIGPNYILDNTSRLVGGAIYAKTAPSGTLEIDIKASVDRGVGWTTIFSTRPTLAAGNKLHIFNPLHISTKTYKAWAVFRLDIVSTGSASGLTVELWMLARYGIPGPQQGFGNRGMGSGPFGG